MSDSVIQFRNSISSRWNPYFNGMILNGIATSKQSKGMTEQADYVRSKLPGKPKPPVIAEVPPETLQKYTGEYDLNGNAVKVIT